MTSKDVLVALRKISRKEKAAVLQRFFKTGPGEYGEGDIFLGVMVPETRRIVKRFSSLPVGEIRLLLHSRYHEARLTALLTLVRRFEQTKDDLERKKIVTFYLHERKYINNWDLVDLSAHQIIGTFFFAKPISKLPLRLRALARSRSVWDRRIAILSTFAAINQGNPKPSLEIAEILLHDKHDLIHKAVGWMLREVGKRCSMQVEEIFLKRHASRMPRTMLRYAIERFPEAKRRRLLLS